MKPELVVERPTSQEATMGPIFTKQELKTLTKYPPKQRSRKISKKFSERISRDPYISMSGYSKYKYCESQIKAIREENNGCVGGGCLGMALGALLSGALGGGTGFVIFILFIIGGAYAGNQLTKSNLSLILPLLEKELIRNKSEHDTQSKELEALKAKEEEAAKIEQQKREIAARNERERKEAMASQKSLDIFEKILKEPKLIRELFPSYREYALLEIESTTPDASAVKAAAQSKELGNAIIAGMFGVYGDSYTPSEDSKFERLIQVLDRERTRIKKFAHAGAHLPFGAIEHFQEVSRSYFGLHRAGGSASIYDEQMIQNEVIAMKESLSVSGNYNDHSTRIDRSTSHTTNIHNAVIDNGKYDEARIKKEILKIVISSDQEESSRAELLAKIPVRESSLLAVLEELQHSGMLQIGNRPSGEIVYRLDRLA